jgi:hypothetical protein
MAVDWIAARLYFEETIGESSSGDTQSVGWFVQDLGPKAAREEPGAPQRGDPHPDNPSLVIDTLSFTPNDAGTTVRATYVLPEYTGSPPPENIADEDYAKIDTTFEDAEVDIPVYQITAQLIRQSGSPAAFLSTVYRPVSEKATYLYSRIVHRITVNATVLSGSGVASQISISHAVQNEANKIHTIGGIDFLFKADGVRRISRETYQFSYRWIYDPGVPNTFINPPSGSLGFDEADISGVTGNGKAGRIGAYVFPYANATFIIPPYSTIVTAPADEEDPTVPPKVHVRLNYKKNASGYLTLPGAV